MFKICDKYLFIPNKYIKKEEYIQDSISDLNQIFKKVIVSSSVLIL